MKQIVIIISLHFITATLLAQNFQFNALVFSKTEGYKHASITEGVNAFKDLAQQHSFDMTWTEDAGIFTKEKLDPFDVVVFLNTSGQFLDKEHQSALMAFIQEGKGFMGVHAASTTHVEWPWFVGLVGASFQSHPYIQSAMVQTIDQTHPATLHLNEKWLWTDEWYVFKSMSDNLNILLTVDEDSYDPHHSWEQTIGMGRNHPIAWYQYYDGGRSFYTALGHLEKSYKNPHFLLHLYGGLYWAATGK